MKQDLEIIRDLMDELIGEMEPGEKDFSERLGREKPELAMVKMEVGPEEEPMEDEEKEIEFEMDPKEELKKRIMKMRG